MSNKKLYIFREQQGITRRCVVSEGNCVEELIFSGSAMSGKSTRSAEYAEQIQRLDPSAGIYVFSRSKDEHAYRALKNVKYELVDDDFESIDSDCFPPGSILIIDDITLSPKNPQVNFEY